MAQFIVSKHLVVTGQKQRTNPCYLYAIAECRRLLRRLGSETEETPIAHAKGFVLRIGSLATTAKLESSSTRGLFPDGYVIRVTPHDIVLSSASAKGILNGVYDLAERLGVAFVLPTEAGELLPDLSQPLTLATGEWKMNPRFKYRGVLAFPEVAKDYPAEDWMRFYAKLRFNSMRCSKSVVGLGPQLGIRLEVGDHGLTALLPRAEFDKHPELFPLTQPEDFTGSRRQKDGNICVTNPQAKAIVQANYAKWVAENPGVYAIHAWPEDLPASGWCLCPSCRALPPTDQAMLAMRYLGETLGKCAKHMRVPVLAYHDTMFPGTHIDAPRNGFLLFAARERCYAHALNDPACSRNRPYYQALQQWMRKFEGIDDAHAFEYYFDQILFRGLYPFLPRVILGDMKTYAHHGIECFQSLQVGGPEIAPEFNMLVFAQALWDETLTAEKAFGKLAQAILPQAPAVLSTYLARRAKVFESAMRMCDHHAGISVDYRWLPESTEPFARQMTKAYARCSAELTAAANALAKAIKASWPDAAKDLLGKEVARARFEARELEVMAHQQSAMNHLGDYHNTGKPAYLNQAKRELQLTLNAFAKVKPAAHAAGIGEDAWYCRNIAAWIGKEIKQKLDRYG